jgi:hypothetical protein
MPADVSVSRRKAELIRQGLEVVVAVHHLIYTLNCKQWIVISRVVSAPWTFAGHPGNDGAKLAR